MFVAIGLAQHALASEQVPTQLAPEDDSIAAAKRDLSTFKSNATNATVSPSAGASPTVSMPQFHSTEPVGIVKPTKPDEKLKAQPSTNWLVDAMMKPKNERTGDRTRDRRQSIGADKDRNTPGRPVLGESAESRDKDAEDDKTNEDKNETRRLHELSNPLGHYMADWLTPQDYALLRKTADAAADRESLEWGSSLPSAASSSGNELGAALAGLGIESFAREKDTSLPAKPVENPYLQAWALSDTPVSTQPPATSSPAQTPAFAPPPVVEPLSSKPTLPDFVKPTSDDKYFKPLKRF